MQYVNGPLNLAAAYDRFNPSKDVKGGSQEDTTIQSYILGGTYDFEVVKIAAAFGQTRNGWFVGQNMGTTPDGMQKLGTFAGRRLPRQFVHGGLHCAAGQQLDLRFLAARRSEERQADQGRCQVQRLQPGLHHDLSKRTNLYAYASYGDNYAFQRDATDTAFAVGLRHRF